MHPENGELSQGQGVMSWCGRILYCGIGRRQFDTYFLFFFRRIHVPANLTERWCYTHLEYFNSPPRCQDRWQIGRGLFFARTQREIGCFRAA